ncbi:MAG: class I SAM-dependent methyltransferase [Proteobacteria bacterium]|nr:class I SAM-dependent methyltransferase [Pseudomonadota bacterium]
MKKHKNSGAELNFLDAGCGDGVNLVGMSRKLMNHSNIRYIGIDYSPLRVSRASALNHLFHVQQASLYNLPFKDNIFDIVLCNHVLEHVPDLSLALGEIYRVLMPGGLLITGVPNEGCLMGRLRNRYVQPSILRKTDHFHFFTEKSFGQSLIEKGFNIQSVEYETFFFPCTHINTLFSQFSIGHHIMLILLHLFPSQAGGFIVASVK